MSSGSPTAARLGIASESTITAPAFFITAIASSVIRSEAGWNPVRSLRTTPIRAPFNPEASRNEV